MTRKLVGFAGIFSALLACLVVLVIGSPSAQSEEAQFVFGTPDEPAEAWLLSAGGRIYDRWWDALDRDEPKETHPAYPADGNKSGSATWRCKECHGWDYRGRDGRYGSGSHYTGIKGINGAKGRDPALIAKLLRDAPHGYSAEMIKDDELARIAAFVSRGQDDTARFVAPETGAVKGDKERGKAIFQSVCAACHGFQGKLLNWGSTKKPAYVGTEANAAPDEVLHKIRNSHPGTAMINLRAFAIEDAAAVLAYAKTLPQK